MFINDLNGVCGHERQYRKPSQVANSSQVNVCRSSKHFLDVSSKKPRCTEGGLCHPFFCFESSPENKCAMFFVFLK